MKQQKAPNLRRLNQRGVVTVDFIFAIITVGAFTALLFSFSYALCVVEVTQYVAFSSARAFSVSNETMDKQKERARQKFEKLTVGNGPIASLYRGDWFTLVKPGALDVRAGLGGDGQQFSEDLAGGGDPPSRNWFGGVSAELTLNILAFRIPGLGATYENDESDFKTRVNAILWRESSAQECRDFMEQRRTALSTLPSGSKFYVPGSYIPLEDNGC